MPTLILPPRYSEDSVRLWRAAGQISWTVHRLRGWRVDAPLEDETLAIYGEPLFAVAVAQQLNHVLLEAPLDWLSHLPERCLHRRVQYTSLAEVATLSYPAFLKPADDKSFPARVYDSPDQLPAYVPHPENIAVLCSDPVNFTVEYRAFVRDRRLTTFSIYARHGVVTDEIAPEPEHHAAQQFLQDLLADPHLALPPAAVIDVGRIDDTTWAVIEANPVYGSGIYQCDPTEVIATLARACLPVRELSDDDARWVVDRPLME